MLELRFKKNQVKILYQISALPGSDHVKNFRDEILPSSNYWMCYNPIGNGKRKLKHLVIEEQNRPQSCLMPKSLIASSQVTIAAALAGNARSMVGPRPV